MKKLLARVLEEMLEDGIHKIGNDGTRYYLLSREQLEEIIEFLDD